VHPKSRTPSSDLIKDEAGLKWSPYTKSQTFLCSGSVSAAECNEQLSKRMKSKCPRVVMLTSRIQTMTAIDPLQLLNQMCLVSLVTLAAHLLSRSLTFF
jgi:hypothetical protein